MQVSTVFTNEVAFKETTLDSFYQFLDERLAHRWSRKKADELLTVYQTYQPQMKWSESLKPYLLYRVANQIQEVSGDLPESQAQIVRLYNDALSDEHCPQFLRPKITYHLARSYYTGRGHPKQNAAKAFQLFETIKTMEGADDRLKQYTTFYQARLLRKGWDKVAKNVSRAKELYSELLQTLPSNDRLLPEVRDGLEKCNASIAADKQNTSQVQLQSPLELLQQEKEALLTERAIQAEKIEILKRTLQKADEIFNSQITDLRRKNEVLEEKNRALVEEIHTRQRRHVQTQNSLICAYQKIYTQACTLKSYVKPLVQKCTELKAELAKTKPVPSNLSQASSIATNQAMPAVSDHQEKPTTDLSLLYFAAQGLVGLPLAKK